MTKVLIKVVASRLPDFYFCISVDGLFSLSYGRTVEEVKARALPMLQRIKEAQDNAIAHGQTSFGRQPRLEEPIEIEWQDGIESHEDFVAAMKVVAR